MQQLVVLLHVIFCVALVILILLQQGKGASMGSGFGGGASNTVFGSRGPASFLMKITGALAAAFFITSLGLGYLSTVQLRAQTQLNAPVVSMTQPVNTQNQNAPVSLAPPAQSAPVKSERPTKTDKK